MKRNALAALLLSTLVISACSSNEATSSEPVKSKESTRNETLKIKELVHKYSVGNISDKSASITSHRLTVTDTDKSQVTYDLPKEEFFVSIAPYIDETHP